MSERWRRVSKDHPCESCGHATWCAWTPDGAFLKCERSSTPPAGFELVKLQDGGALFRPEGVHQNGRPERTGTTRKRANAKQSQTRDWAVEAGRFEAAISDAQIQALARDLSVHPESLRELEIGWATREDLRRLRAGGQGWQEDYPDGAYTFPERDAAGQVIGLSLRAEDGRKGSPSGASRGLIYTIPFRGLEGLVHIVEGATDVAGAATLGLIAVGRPSNSGGVDHLAELLRGRDSLVLGENDERDDGRWPGRNGAITVAEGLARACGGAVAWALPPAGTKDVRAWLAEQVEAGLDLADRPACEAAGKVFLARLASTAQTALPGKQDGACPAERVEITWRDPEGDRPLHAIVPAGVAALAETHSDNVFVRGGSLVRVLRGDTHISSGIQRSSAARINLLPDPILRAMLDEAARWIKVTKKVGTKETWVPQPVVAAIRDIGEWPALRALGGVVGAPTLRPDGTVLDTPGYDDATALVYSPTRSYPPIPTRPSPDDVRAALKALLDPWSEFPYDSDADRAAHLGLLLTQAARPAIRGPVPHFVFSAPTSRTGKTLLGQSSVVAMTGDQPDTMGPVGGRPSEADAEMRKRIMTLVMEGTRVALVDNLPDGATYTSPVLASAITSTVWTDRRLGASERVHLPHEIIWLASGNNISVAADIAGRSLSIRLDARMEDPGVNRRFRLSNLPSYVEREHPQLLCAALTVLRGFVVAGQPGHGSTALGMFEAWDALVRGCVIWAGDLVGRPLDPLETQARLRQEAPDSNERGTLLRALLERFPAGAAVKARDIVAAATRSPDLTEALLAFAAGKDGRISAQVLGTRLAAARGTVVGGLVLEQRGVSNKTALWAVCRVDQPAAGGGTPGSPGSVAGSIEGIGASEGDETGEEGPQLTQESRESPVSGRADDRGQESNGELGSVQGIGRGPAPLDGQRPPARCFACRREPGVWWRRRGGQGQWTCEACYPPAIPVEDVEHWGGHHDA